jgi:hypothetical protein
MRVLRSSCVLAWFVAHGALAALEPAELLTRIRGSTLVPADAVALRNVKLELGPAIFEMQRGILFPAAPVAGRTVELVFIGQARFLLDAPDEIEAGQLELFTGERSLEAPVEEAVLVLANDEAVAELLRGPPPHEVRPELKARAEDIHRRWLERAERRLAGVESAIFKLLIGDEAFQQYFALWCHSFELGDFVYQLDPEEQEQITLASFHPIELTGWERLRLKHHIRVQQRKGRWLDVRVEDLGAWDVWMSRSWSPRRGPALPGTAGFEPEHYELDVTLKKRNMLLEGRARLHLKAETAGRRVLRLQLMQDLRVSRVADAEGRELYYFRSGDETAVLLPEPSTVGDTLVLDVTYAGPALEWIANKSYDLQDTSNWYPRCGTVDRATYDVTLRWPKKYDVMASGRLVDRGREGHFIRERRRLDLPSIAFSFAVGDFVIERKQVGDTTVTVAFSRRGKARPSPEVRAGIVEAVSGSLQFFEDVFGDYPLDELTVVTVPRKFSQSYLGFVTLADSLVRFSDPAASSAVWQRDTTIAHELAHQWWGNMVGWWSYRDQWLSEGMANYSALLYDSRKSGGSNLAIMSSGWRKSLSQTTLEGRTVESLGPIVLGNRLNSSRAHNAYRTIVYRKGAVVLAMLARAVGEEQFLQMLRSLVDVAAHRVLTTESFLKALERMSGLELQGFARQFIYGTGIPEVYYGYDLEHGEDGGWTLQGEASLLFTPHYQHQVVRRADGGWDVERRRGSQPELGPTTLMVPYLVTLDEHSTPAAGAPSDARGASRQSGQLFLQGRQDEFEIGTGRRPVDLRLDPHGEILAWFYSAKRHPKRFLQYQAADLAAAGEWDAAEARFLEALRLPGQSSSRDPLGPAPELPGAQGSVQDLKIRLALVRLYTEQGREEETLAALDEIDRDLASNQMMFRMQRDALRSRMEIRQGRYDAAYRRLKKTLKLASPRNDRTSWRNVWWQYRLNTERSAVTEAFSLLAIAAYETGNEEMFLWALREARNRGVDVGPLEPVDG